ncbi:MAG: hypothetical protein WA484_09430, partial [Solirubrobacteraceae bacterium]
MPTPSIDLIPARRVLALAITALALAWGSPAAATPVRGGHAKATVTRCARKHAKHRSRASRA